MSEAQEISHRRRNPIRRSSRRWASTTIPSCSATSATSGSGSRRSRSGRNLPWRFTVVDQPAVNAFALPGGFIYITRGILPFLDNEAELAGVLGHEIGHVTARHSAQQYTRADRRAGRPRRARHLRARGAAVRRSREPGARRAVPEVRTRRRAAGRRARRALRRRRAGGIRRACPAFLSTLGRLDEARGRSHAACRTGCRRIPIRCRACNEIQPLVAEAQGGRRETSRPTATTSCSASTASSSATTRSRASSAATRSCIRRCASASTFPQGWEVAQQPAAGGGEGAGRRRLHAAAARAEAAGARHRRRSRSSSMQQRRLPRGAGRAHDDQRARRVRRRLPGTDRGARRGRRARGAHRARHATSTCSPGSRRRDVFQQADSAFLGAIRSFRPLSAAEAENIRPNRVDLYVVRAGDTWQSIARAIGRRRSTPATLAIMNNVDAGVAAAAGRADQDRRRRLEPSSAAASARAASSSLAAARLRGARLRLPDAARRARAGDDQSDDHGVHGAARARSGARRAEAAPRAALGAVLAHLAEPASAPCSSPKTARSGSTRGSTSSRSASRSRSTWSAGAAVRGASTITQQLAKNLYLSPSRNPLRKLRELIIARRLEAALPKARILEIYLNVIEWGDGIWGAEAAARTYFGVSGVGAQRASRRRCWPARSSIRAC